MHPTEKISSFCGFSANTRDDIEKAPQKIQSYIAISINHYYECVFYCSFIHFITPFQNKHSDSKLLDLYLKCKLKSSLSTDNHIIQHVSFSCCKKNHLGLMRLPFNLVKREVINSSNLLFKATETFQ